ncbi:MAG: hypothetical protein ABI831_05350 [Betaproteobacteria bacterium]
MTLIELVRAFRSAAMAAELSSAQAPALVDAFHAMIAQVPLAGPQGQPLAAMCFDAIISQVQMLPDERTFEPTMVAADTLAACVLASPGHAGTIARWAARDHPAPRTGAMRAYSKLCEYDTSLVDGDVLCALAQRLDASGALGGADQTTLGYLGQVAGRLRGEDKGMRLIELLAAQGAPSRAIAAHAIGYSVAMDPPSSRLSAFARFGPSRLTSAAPTRRLLQLFAALTDDADATVAQAAEQSATVIRHAWPELDKRMANLIATVRGLPKVPDRQAAGSQPRSVDFALHAPSRISRRHGVLAWSPDLLEQDLQAEADGEILPAIIGAPRLFISYRWSDEVSEDTLVDFLVGGLYGRGYDIAFDRDPRVRDRGLNADDVLGLMHGCTHFVPVVTDELRRYLARRRTGPQSALDREWALARKLSQPRNGLRWLSLWMHGERLPRALATRAHVDLRDNHDALDHVFPSCRFEVRAFDRGDKIVHRSAPVTRLHLRAAWRKAQARRGSVRCEVHDVTDSRSLSFPFESIKTGA